MKPNRKLKGLRAEHNLTQVELAEKLGMSEYSYIKKENGETEFKVSEVNKILEIFNARYEDIFLSNEYSKA